MPSYQAYNQQDVIIDPSEDWEIIFPANPQNGYWFNIVTTSSALNPVLANGNGNVLGEWGGTNTAAALIIPDTVVQFMFASPSPGTALQWYTRNIVWPDAAACSADGRGWAPGSLDGTWQTMQLTNDTTTARYMLWDDATDSFTITMPGKYQLIVSGTFTHNELNQGRETFIRLFNITDNVAVGDSAIVATGRNVGATAFTIPLMFATDTTIWNKRLELQIGNGDDYSTVVFDRLDFQTFNISPELAFPVTLPKSVFETGSFVSTAGPQEISLSKFTGTTPKAVIIWHSGQGADGISAGAKFGFGAGTSSASAAIADWSTDGVGTSASGAYSSSNCLINSSDTGTKVEEASIALDIGKFILTYGTSQTANKYNYLAIGGTDVEASLITAASSGATVSAPHGLSGTPDAIIAYSCTVNGIDGSNPNAQAAVGLYGNGKQRLSVYRDSNNLATSQTLYGYQSDMFASLASNAYFIRGSISSVDATNVNMAFDFFNASRNQYMLCLKGVSADVLSTSQPATNSTVGYSLGFPPKAAIGATPMGVSPTVDQSLTNGRIGVGASDFTAEAFSGAVGQDAQPTTNTDSVEASAFIQHIDFAQNIVGNCTLDVIDNNISEIWTQCDGTQRESSYLVLGEYIPPYVGKRFTQKVTSNNWLPENSWNSQISLDGDFSVSWRYANVPTVYGMVGIQLSDTPHPSVFPGFAAGVQYLDASTLRVYSNNVSADYPGVTTINSVIRFDRTGSDIAIYADDVLIHTLTGLSAGYYAACSVLFSTSIIPEIIDMNSITIDTGLIGSNINVEDFDYIPPWTPADIATTAWYDPSDASTITLDTGVSVLADKSGNAYDMTQPTAGLQPLLTDFGNGKNCLAIDATNELIASIPQADGQQIFVVVDTTALPTGYRVLWDRAPATTPPALYLGGPSFQTPQIYWGTNSAIQAASVTRKALVEYNLAIPDTSTRVDDNDATLSTTTHGQTSLGSWATFGTNSYQQLVANIAELVMVPAALSTADRNRMAGYLAWKWGIEGNLPAGHPYKNSPPTK